jgi:nitrous oxidase accessory protein NosD
MRNHRSLVRGFLGGLLLTAVGVAAVAAYSGEVAGTVQVSAPSGLQACNTPITITANIEDIDGKPIEGQPVTWSFISGNVAGDTILDTSSTTNASGVATTQAQFACTAHSVTIGAVADAVSGTAVVALSGDGLPGTDTAPPSSFVAIALAALAVLIGSATILRRVAADRR